MFHLHVVSSHTAPHYWSSCGLTATEAWGRICCARDTHTVESMITSVLGSGSLWLKVTVGHTWELLFLHLGRPLSNLSHLDTRQK